MSTPTPALPDFRTVAVCYRLPPGAFARRLRGLLSGLGMRLSGVVVGNHPAHAASAHMEGLHAIRGTNAHLDFSGYFEGLDHLLSGDPEAAAGNVLFVNDSIFTRHSAATLVRRTVALHPLLQQLQVPAIAGKTDPYRSICLSNPWSGHPRYVSSFCFLLNAPALPALRRLPNDARADGVLSQADVADPAWGHGMHPVLREQIRAHLVYRWSPYRWQGRPSNDPDLLRKKAQCVYFEHRLSGAVGLGGAVVPINSGPRSSAGVLLGETMARLGRALTGQRQ